MNKEMLAKFKMLKRQRSWVPWNSNKNVITVKWIRLKIKEIGSFSVMRWKTWMDKWYEDCICNSTQKSDEFRLAVMHYNILKLNDKGFGLLELFYSPVQG